MLSPYSTAPFVKHPANSSLTTSVHYYMHSLILCVGELCAFLCDFVAVLPATEAVDDKGNSALMLAASNGWYDVVEHLIGLGLRRHRKNYKGETAFDKARAAMRLASEHVANGFERASEKKQRCAKAMRMLDERSVLQCAADDDFRRFRYVHRYMR